MKSEGVLSVREVLFGKDSPRWRGRGAGIALLDSGIGAAPGFGSRLVNRMREQGETPRSLSGNAHALRVASICAEGDEVGASPLGIAPAATVLTAAYAPLVPLGIPDWLNAHHGLSLHILGLPWSAPENAALALLGRASIASLTSKVLVVAAAGHDGVDTLRFPGTCTEALTVGVCDAQGKVLQACGTDAEERKPELMVPAGPFMARLEDGSVGHVGGTSAAVGVVSGLAALWVEAISSAGAQPNPWLLRAALLAGSREGPSPTHRIASADGLLNAEVNVLELIRPIRGHQVIRLRARHGGVVRVAVATCHPTPQGRWLSEARPVRLNGPGRSAGGDRWCVLQLEVKAGAHLDLTLEVSGSPHHVGIVAIGPEGLQLETLTEPLPKRKPLVIVGISASHDASACVMVDGQLKSAVQLERISRVKHDGVGYLADMEAASYCLDSAGLRPDEVDLFAFNCQPLLPGRVGLSEPCPDESFTLFDPFGPKAVFVSHHLSHAFSAYYGAGVPEATVVVADGSGGGVCGANDCVLRGGAFRDYLESGADANEVHPLLHTISTYHFTPQKFRLTDRERAPSFNVRVGSSSLGETYATVSQYIFGDWRDSGKVMGLAPYGDAKQCGPTLLSERDGLLNFNAAWKNSFRKGKIKADPMTHRDLAARIQADIEEALLGRFTKSLRTTGCGRIAYAGGIALNCVANSKILANTRAESFFVFPASHDAGVAVGAAAAAHHRTTGQAPQCHGVYEDFLGHPYGDRDIKLALRTYANVLNIVDLDVTQIAAFLACGEYVGWFHAGSEFGPRALGHRSILADPRDSAAWKGVNSRVKYREDFRPFAPVVPAELAAEWFDIDRPMPYMTFTAQVKPERRELLQAVTHVDGSARVQTVDRASQPVLHDLLLRFGELTGVPVLLNTSLNVRGQPLVETPAQAVELMLGTGLHRMVLGKRVAAPLHPIQEHLTEVDLLILSPDARVVLSATVAGSCAYIESQLRTGVAYSISPLCAQLLTKMDGKKSVGELLMSVNGDVETDAVMNLLAALHAERLLLVARTHG